MTSRLRSLDADRRQQVEQPRDAGPASAAPRRAPTPRAASTASGGHPSRVRRPRRRSVRDTCRSSGRTRESQAKRVAAKPMARLPAWSPRSQAATVLIAAARSCRIAGLRHDTGVRAAQPTPSRCSRCRPPEVRWPSPRAWPCRTSRTARNDEEVRRRIRRRQVGARVDVPEVADVRVRRRITRHRGRVRAVARDHQDEVRAAAVARRRRTGRRVPFPD